MSTTVCIKMEYEKAKAAAAGGEPNVAALSRTCKMAESTMRKIRDEIRDHGRVLSPEETRRGKHKMEASLSFWSRLTCTQCCR